MIESDIAQERTPGVTEYFADEGLATSARVALELGQPLLLTGEPGTGKTSFAGHVATALGPDYFRKKGETGSGPFALHLFETKSTSVASDLFYRFDSLRRFQAAHTPDMSSDNRDYITFEALGQAIIESLPFSEVSDLAREESTHRGPRRSVVLIDEIDKAPRDFPNDLLNEIERNYFRMPEWIDPRTGRMRTVAANPRLRPIVILTSNSEKNLPAPFLRRCIFHHIRFPGRDQKDRLTRIIQSRLPGDSGTLVDSARDFFYDVRDKLQLEKMPTSHELIQWIRILHTPNWFGEDVRVADRTLFDLPLGRLKDTLGVIAKTAGDRAEIESLLATQLKR